MRHQVIYTMYTDIQSENLHKILNLTSSGPDLTVLELSFLTDPEHCGLYSSGYGITFFHP